MWSHFRDLHLSCHAFHVALSAGLLHWLDAVSVSLSQFRLRAASAATIQNIFRQLVGRLLFEISSMKRFWNSCSFRNSSMALPIVSNT